MLEPHGHRGGPCGSCTLGPLHKKRPFKRSIMRESGSGRTTNIIYKYDDDNLPDLQDKFTYQKELDPVLIFDSPLAGYFLPPGRKQLEASGGRNSTRGSSKSGEAPDFGRNYETIQKHTKLQIRVRPKNMQRWGERPGNARIKSMMKIEDSAHSLVQPLPTNQSSGLYITQDQLQTTHDKHKVSTWI